MTRSWIAMVAILLVMSFRPAWTNDGCLLATLFRRKTDYLRVFRLCAKTLFINDKRVRRNQSVAPVSFVAQSILLT
ncbi:hypothetical protein SAMN05216409_110243 [Pseudomonas lutea]|uniref:Uncharacterized protein n=1 Tax=Pseudomonas lutea TaxID=243924 RepID=A0A9X8QKP7_9PSED|nr:hypothetical protein SAMN05216409_110243 [Pseudomonas lutea]